MSFRDKSIFLILFLTLSFIGCKENPLDQPDPIPQPIPAFPGAEGFGSLTKGGRDGKVIEVTNLLPSGPGSFLEACKAQGQRIIIFRTGGIIKIKTPITISSPYVTIAGQTAPGDGICIQGAGITIATHDVILRGLRVRVGDDPNGPNGEGRDAITIANSSVQPYNIIIDHCSASWAIDENMGSWYPAHDITIQYCITGEALDSSLHVKGPHSKGMLIGPGAQRVSIHHNLFAHNVERNPLISVDTRSEFVNNVIYNWKSRGLNLGNCYPEHEEASDVIGNYFKRGPNSNTLSIQISNCWQHALVYLKGNIGPGRTTDTGDEWANVRNDVGAQIKSTNPVIESLMSTYHSAEEAYSVVLESAGATVPHRDPVDLRIVNDVKNGTGKIIDSQDEVGGWSVYDKGIAPADTDKDGIPDDWENANGLNPNLKGDGFLKTTEGYTNLEVYINSYYDSYD